MIVPGFFSHVGYEPSTRNRVDVKCHENDIFIEGNAITRYLQVHGDDHRSRAVPVFQLSRLSREKSHGERKKLEYDMDRDSFRQEIFLFFSDANE